MTSLMDGCATFWHGPRLSAMERACLASFRRNDVPFTLFSYTKYDEMPPDVVWRDAAEIVPEQILTNLSHHRSRVVTNFSNYFRYEMIRKTGLIWVDADILLLDAAAAGDFTDLVVREKQGGYNNALLYSENPEFMSTMSSRALSNLQQRGEKWRWGESGPLLLTSVMKDFDSTVGSFEPAVFFPLEHYEIWKAFLPEHREFCDAETAKAATVHLFNNIIVTMGYWKDVAPPPGSFLHQTFAELDLLGEFDAVYPVSVARQNIENFRLSQNGKALGIKSVARELVPSIRRTINHYRA